MNALDELRGLEDLLVLHGARGLVRGRRARPALALVDAQEHVADVLALSNSGVCSE